MTTGDRDRPVYNYRGESKLLNVVEMTDREYIEFDMLFAFHRKQFAKERKKALETLFLAYIHKHHIFGQPDGKEAPAVLTQEEAEAMYRMMQSFDNAAFRRPLAGKALPPSKQ